MKRIDPKTRHRLKRLIQGVIFMSVLIGIMKLDWKIRGPEAMRHLSKIEGELGELRPFPNALLMSKNHSVKPEIGDLAATYVVQGESSADIERWYKEEFGRLNWKPLSVESHQSNRLLTFCRNGEEATLILPEESLAAKTEFTIDMGWGGPCEHVSRNFQNVGLHQLLVDAATGNVEFMNKAVGKMRDFSGD
jgi:hypothetical protein